MSRQWHDDSWRDSYDAWKLASPDDYEVDDDPEEQDRDSLEAEIDRLIQLAETDEQWAEIRRLQAILDGERPVREARHEPVDDTISPDDPTVDDIPF